MSKIRSLQKTQKRKDRKDLTQRNSKNYKQIQASAQTKEESGEEKSKSKKHKGKKQKAASKTPKMSQSQKEAARRKAVTKDRKEDIKDGEIKEIVYAEGASSKLKPLPESNKDTIGGKHEQRFQPGLYSKRFLREQETKVEPIITYQDRVLPRPKRKMN